MTWYYAVDDAQQGPVDEEELAGLIGQGVVGPQTLVWREGMDGWEPARAALPGHLILQSWVDDLSVPGVAAGAASVSAGSATGAYYHPTTFVDAVKMVLRRYVQFRGRARRSEFWWFYLFNLIISLPLTLLDFALFDPALALLGVLSSVFALAMFVPSLAVSARRLHDTDRSAWWLLLVFAPVPLSFFSAWLSAICLLLVVPVFLWFFTRPSDPQDNRFGPA